MPSETGKPQPIPFARPSIGVEEENAVLSVLRSGWLTTGPVTAEFERAFAEEIGIEHAIAVSSGTAGLHLALEAAGVGRGDTVVTTPYTFTATAEVIRYLGADPWFADIKPDAPNIDPGRLEEAIAGRPVAAVVPVHVGGEPCDMDRILTATGRAGIPVIEDAAHAFPAHTQTGRCGTLGRAGAFSFYANKPITTGEGGMVVTGDGQLASRMRTMRLHGIDRSVWDRYTGTKADAWSYDVVAPGYKYNLPDTASAIGIAQLAKAERFHRRRRDIAAQYTKAFSSREYLEPPGSPEGHAWHLYQLLLRLEMLSIDRDGFVSALESSGIGTSVHYKPLHLMRYYRERYRLTPEDFPEATRRYRRTVSVPIYPGLTDEEVARVIDSVLSVGDRNMRHRHASRRTKG